MLKIPKKVDFYQCLFSGYVCIFFFRKLKKRIIALLWCTIPWNIYLCYVATKKLVTCNKMYATIAYRLFQKKKSFVSPLAPPASNVYIGNRLIASFWWYWVYCLKKMIIISLKATFLLLVIFIIIIQWTSICNHLFNTSYTAKSFFLL